MSYSAETKKTPDGSDAEKAAPAKKPAEIKTEAKIGDTKVETRAKTGEALKESGREYERDAEDAAEEHPDLEHARDVNERLKDLAKSHQLEIESEGLRRQYVYTVPHGVSHSAALGAGVGGAALLAASAPLIWQAMDKVKFALGPAGAPIAKVPAWLGTTLPVAGSIAAAYGGYQLGGFIGKWIAKHTHLKEHHGVWAGRLTGTSLAGWAGYAGTDLLLKQGLSPLLGAHLTNFSWAYGLPGALLGAWAGGVVGEKIGDLFHHPGAGRWIGRIGGGVGVGWAMGAAHATILPFWPGALVAAGAATGVWGLGRVMQNILGWERKGVLGTMWDAPKGLVVGATNIVSWIGNKIRAPFRGMKNAIEENPSHGFLEKTGHFAMNAGTGLWPGRKFGRNPVVGAAHGLGFQRDRPIKNQENLKSYKFGRAIGSVPGRAWEKTKNVLSWPFKYREGSGAAANGHGNGHGH